MSTGGAGINTGAVNTSSNGNVSSGSNNVSNVSQSPYAPANNEISQLLSQISGDMGGQNIAGGNYNPDYPYYSQVQANLNQIPNFGPAASNAASGIFGSGGDPSGLLHTAAGNLSSVAGEGANGGAGLDPLNTPGMAGVLAQIQNDVQNSVNGQFAGAGRSLPGLNQQDLSRGLSQGEAVPLLNQYNQNVSNMMGANSQLGALSQDAVSNLGVGLNMAQAAPGLASSVPYAQIANHLQEALQPFQILSSEEGLVNPIAGLGGNTSTVGSGNTNVASSNTGQTLNTGSLISALSSLLGGANGGIAGGVQGLLGNLFGG